MAEILLVDDDPLVRQPVRLALERAGHVVEEAEDGSACLDKLRRRTFDLVVLDLVMPERDGIETILTIRREGGQVPILAISGGGHAVPNLLSMARKLGADEGLQKPFSQEELLAVVGRLLEGRAVSVDPA